jgi:MFS family permease
MTAYRQRSIAYNYACAVVLGSGGFYFGYYDGIYNPMFRPMMIGVYGYDEIKDKTKLDDINGLVNMLFSIGAMIGVLSTGFLADRFGRRTILYAGEFIALVTMVLYRIISIEVLMTTRVISGMVAGINSSIYAVMIAEMLPNSMVGFGNGFAYLLLTFALLLSYLSQNIFEYQTLVDNWVAVFVWPAIVSIARLISFPIFIKSDTPRYMYTQCADMEAAVAMIKDAYVCVYVDVDAEKAAREAVEYFEKERSEGEIGVMVLFGPRFRKRMLSGCFITFAQQISGINFLVYYSTRLFDEIGGYGQTITLVVGLCNFLGSICAIYLISKMGRKFNLVVGPMFQAIGMVGLYFGYLRKELWILVVSVIVYMIPYAIGLGGTLTAYVGEILPPLGVGLAFSVQWLMTAIVGQFMPRLITDLGPGILIIFFAIVCFIIVFIMDYLTIETKGKSESEIANEFINKKYKFMDLK